MAGKLTPCFLQVTCKGPKALSPRPHIRTGTGTPGQHPPIHVIFMAVTGRFLPRPNRFCIVEAPAKEWSFNNAPVPWILPAGYCNPNETVPDFPDDDNGAVGSFGKESESAPLTGTSAEVTVANDAEEEDDRFETVDDG